MTFAPLTESRFIPARAGNTPFVPPRSLVLSVHPRTCGEYLVSFKRCGHTIGSSPHVRGILYTLLAQEQGKRFIPARAGNTSPIAAREAVSAVHPRTCGEYKRIIGKGMLQHGSSPHVRGIRVCRERRDAA